MSKFNPNIGVNNSIKYTNIACPNPPPINLSVINNTHKISPHINIDKGFRPSTTMEIASGAPSHQYESFNSDNKKCQNAKLINNLANNNIQSSDCYINAGDNIANVITNNIMVNASQNQIDKYCIPNGFKFE